MATETRAELPVIFDCNLGEDGLAEFEPEVQPYAASPTRRWWPLAVPVLVLGVIAGGVGSWLGLTAGSASRSSMPRPAVSNVLSDASNEAPVAAPVLATV